MTPAARHYARAVRDWRFHTEVTGDEQAARVAKHLADGAAKRMKREQTR